MITGKLDNSKEPICPKCHQKLDGFTGVIDKPKFKDVSICIYCCSVLEFQENMDLLPAPKDVLSDKRVQDLLEEVKRISPFDKYSQAGIDGAEAGEKLNNITKGLTNG